MLLITPSQRNCCEFDLDRSVNSSMLAAASSLMITSKWLNVLQMQYKHVQGCKGQLIMLLIMMLSQITLNSFSSKKERFGNLSFWTLRRGFFVKY